MISSADFGLYLGCGSTGMPRPSSRTSSLLPGSNSTWMVSAWPATASSMALSSTSATRWCIARSSVPPIYMPGRLRTDRSNRSPLFLFFAMVLVFVGGRRGSPMAASPLDMVGKAREINYIRWRTDVRIAARPDHPDRAAACGHERQRRYLRRLGAVADGYCGRHAGGPGGAWPG